MSRDLPPSPDPVIPSGAWRQRLLVLAAALLLLVSVAVSVAIALAEPSVGWRFVPDPQGQGLLAYVPQRAVKITQREQAEARVVALRAGGRTLALDSLVAVEAPSMLSRQDQLERFFQLQAQAWDMLAQARALGTPVEFQRADGSWISREVRARAWDELGLLYWLPLLCGVVPFVIGAGVGRYRWRNAGARALTLAGVMALLSLAEVSVVTGRLWLLPPWFADAGQVWVRCTSLGALWAFGMLVLHYPTPMRQARLWTLGTGTLLVLNILQWPASLVLRYKLWLVAGGFAILLLGLAQSLRNRGDPVHRAAARWLGASVALCFSVVFYSFAVSLIYDAQAVSNSYRWLGVPLLYVGLLLSVGRANLFELERWWVPLVLWYLGGTLVLVTDLALVAWLRVDAGAAITLSLLVIGWLYFPARQWLLTRLALWSRPRVVTYVPDLIAAVNAGLAGEHAAARAWRELLQRVFQPVSIAPVAQAGPVGQAQVRDEGRLLQVPGVAGALELSLAYGGRRLFSHEHVRITEELWRLLDHGLAQQRQTQLAVERERQRIASDLHDDLGARLLTLVQAGSHDGTAPIARQALEEMRQSVRGMAGRAVPAEVALADWRAELVGRLQGARITPDWQVTAPEGDDLMLSPRLHLELTRVLREAVSNVIRHSGASHCAVRIALGGGRLAVQVDDDGRGLGEAPQGQGLGLPGLERRARKLGGQYRLGASALGGVQVRVDVPLAQPGDEAGAAAGASATIGA